MRIEVCTDWDEDSFQLVYREAEHSFMAVPKPYGGITSVLVNDLQLEVDDRGIVLYAWGLFPRAKKCNPTTSRPPNARRLRLRFIPDEDWTPGVSTRLNKQSWDVFANRSDGWVGVGNPDTPRNSQAIEFAPNSIAVLDGGSIIAVWLKPAIEAIKLQSTDTTTI